MVGLLILIGDPRQTSLEGLTLVQAADSPLRMQIAGDPVDDVRGSAEYRLMLVPELLKRAIGRAKEAQS